MSSADRIRAVAHALTPDERRRRFEELKEVVVRQGGILLDPETEELVALGELLGARVEYVRVDLPTGMTPPAPPSQVRREAPQRPPPQSTIPGLTTKTG